MMDAPNARKLFDQIRKSVETLSDLIRAAWEQEAWKAVGYASWDDCCAVEFPELKVTSLQRLRVVGELTNSGMSDRAIAVALNVDNHTVARSRSGGESSPPDRNVTGRDGKQYGRSYQPGSDTAHRLRELSKHGLSMASIARTTGIQEQTLTKVKNGKTKNVRPANAESIHRLYAQTFGIDYAPPAPEPDPAPLADVVPIQMKTGPQLSAARAQARHSLVSAAITLQKAARQIGAVDPRYLRFGNNDPELDLAPEIIREAVKSINQSMKEIHQ